MAVVQSVYLAGHLGGAVHILARARVCVCQLPIAPRWGGFQSMLCSCLWQFFDALYAHLQCKRQLVRRSLTYSMS